jgi:hypothetical protein
MGCTTGSLSLVLLGVAVVGSLLSCGDGSTGTAASSSTTALVVPDGRPVIDPGDGGDYRPEIDRADFVEDVDNPWFPLVPGTRWEYEGEADGTVEHTTVVVTPERRTVMGVSTVVVRDTVTADGEVVEDTYDWYAQDVDGAVWYFGEAVSNFEDGRLEDTDGSWEAGVDGALPGIVMLARPAVGDAYRQEYDEGEAEDMGEVVRTGGHVEVPFGSYDDVLVTRDWNPLEPDVVEEKYYASGVGLIGETVTAGGDERSVLVEHVPAG